MRTSAVTVISLMVYFYVVIFGVDTAKSGPYKIDLRKIEQCEDVGTNEAGLYNLTKEENGNLKVQFYLGSPMDKKFKICVEGQEITSNGSTNVLHFNCKDCDQAWIFLGGFLTKLMISSGIQPEKCSFPKGEYTASNWDASEPISYVPRMNYNNFIFKVSYLVEDKKIGCNLFNVKIIPRE